MAIEDEHVLQQSLPKFNAGQEEEVEGLSAVGNQTDRTNITVHPDPNVNQNALYGIVADTSTNLPINNATVELFQVQGCESLSEGLVVTNAEGQYLFADLPIGQYYIVATKSDFLPNQSDQIHLAAQEYASVNIHLNVDENVNTGTVSGMIKDKVSGAPIADAIVALYELTGSIETLTLITRTNAAGLYMFGNLPQGQYKVKATVHAVSE
ncbi:carboxypeptidase-like regulatory domain-containing protein [Paenibacillus sp. MER TA 81-3]|uniref:MSCRAMM family protein n=1 Tax=Paenibacillus sp. MER TA 81-3 TaxID=2939573 RepID=UPI00203FD8F8|nr:carboxypeptidase-like regulatory domain-containing protein [Paenibacillus sp. MER TA 81-3]MCM3340777.1 carboxypeptidase-like regulatory domain-containing protein [Paenibacillus sp. MER TA 81-3]